MRKIYSKILGVALLAMTAVNASAESIEFNGTEFKGALKQGTAYTLPEDVVEAIESNGFFYNTDYFTKNADGTFTFNAIDGNYNITINTDKLFFNIYPVTETGEPGSFGTVGAVWVEGSDIGIPSVEKNRNNWGEANGWSPTADIALSPAQISTKVYQLTLTEGVQIQSGAEFKYYGNLPWDGEGSPWTDGTNNADVIDLQTDLVSFSNNNLKANFAEGETYVLTLDLTGDKAVLKVETLEEHNAATGIQSIVKNERSNNSVYTLSGIRVEKATKAGIYIQNGKKVVIK